MALQIVYDEENKLLRRRELKAVFSQMAGKLTRNDALKAVAEALNIEQDKVYLISLSCKSGTRDLEGIFYVYQKGDDARRQLPPYIFLRMLPPEERKKALEAKRRSKR
ncbi:MAG: hypothetical protein QW815_03450 [Nitrososphaerota archaeon]